MARQSLHIVFDAHNVLFRPNYRQILAILIKMPHKLVLLSYFFKIQFLRNLYAATRKEGLGQGSFMLLESKYPFLHAYDATIVELCSAQYPLYSTFAIIDKLQHAYPIHILSNMGFQTLQNLQARFSDYFKNFSTIHYFGPATDWKQKPHASPYQTLLKTLGITASQMIFIDNSLRNITAAQELGIKTIHYTSAKQLEKALQGLHLL